jgi:two-component system, sensor histidine kinase
MQKNKSLFQIVVKQALPKVMGLAVLVTVVLFISFFLFIKEQLKNKHRAQLDQIENIAMANVNNVVSQVDNLAKNDLIINSLIDFEYRENYLTVFFQSLKVTESPDVAIGFLNFNGEPIVVKNWSLYEQAKKSFNWKNEVYDKATISIDISKHGVLIAAPVLYAEQAEGAILVYIKSLQDLITYSSSLGVQVLVDDEYEVLYSSKPGVIPVGSTVSRQILSKSYYVQSDSRWWRGFSVESLTKAYQGVLQIIIMMFFLLMVVIFSTNYSARISARIASQALRSLKDNINDASNGRSPINHPISSREPSEIATIKASFNTLLHDLLNTSLSRDRFESVINSMNEPLLVLDHERNVVLQNRCMFELGQEFRLSFPEDFDELFPEKTWDDLSKTGEHEIDYGAFKTKFKKHVIMQWRMNEYVSGGKAIGSVLVGHDLTKQKSMAFDLLIKNKAIDEASTAIVITDMISGDQPVVYVNKAFLKLTGYQLEDVIGKNCRMLQGENTSAEHRKLISEKIKAQQTLDITLTNYRKGGQAFANNLILSPITDENGKLTHYIGFQHDVTEQEKVAEYLKSAKEKAEQSAQMKSEFLASMSHEIRTPMNGVIGTLSLMLREELSEQQREYAVVAKDSADSLLTLINDILDFSKIEAGKLNIESSEVDIAQLTQSVCRTFKTAAESKKIKLTFNIDKLAAKRVLTDANRLRQVLNNVIGNALKFTQEGSVEVSVAALRKKDGNIACKWTIKDTGIGITPDRASAIFDAFTQADNTTTRNFGGTGLGLSISKQLCKLMGGNISVKSDIGKGSEFTFWVTATEISSISSIQPEIQKSDKTKSSTQGVSHARKPPEYKVSAKVEDSINESNQTETVKLVPDLPASNDSEATSEMESNNIIADDVDSYADLDVVLDVLLVEDNRINQMVAKKMLTSCGLYVEVANNGQEALERLNDTESGQFDIVFMDCHMPILDGYETTAAIRNGTAGEHNRNIPIIAMTANAMKGDKEKCFEVGMDDYMSKPINQNVLRHSLAFWYKKITNGN